MPQFTAGLRDVVAATGGNFTHTLEMFSTKYLDTVLRGYV